MYIGNLKKLEVKWIRVLQVCCWHCSCWERHERCCCHQARCWRIRLFQWVSRLNLFMAIRKVLWTLFRPDPTWKWNITTAENFHDQIHQNVKFPDCPIIRLNQLWFDHSLDKADRNVQQFLYWDNILDSSSFLGTYSTQPSLFVGHHVMSRSKNSADLDYFN
jgi:hypothetical protein